VAFQGDAPLDDPADERLFGYSSGVTSGIVIISMVW
jgi:hypothetical protein